MVTLGINALSLPVLGGGGLLGPRLTIFTDKKDALVGFF